MLAPPIDLDMSGLTAALRDGWSIRDPALDYLAVGFGSHHWRCDDAGGRSCSRRCPMRAAMSSA